MTRALLSCERGNSFVEMAFAAPVLASLLLGMIDISRGVADKLELTQIAQRTIERVQRTGYSPSNSSVLEAEAETVAGTGSNATVTAWLECGNSSTQLSFTGSCSSGQAYARYVRITVTRPFTPLFGSRFFPGANDDGTYTINGEAGIRIQ
ncbi:MAG: TadE/TadG family type IV pilus assembly protein [Alphaproteobacteria bacterium]